MLLRLEKEFSFQATESLRSRTSLLCFTSAYHHRSIGSFAYCWHSVAQVSTIFKITSCHAKKTRGHCKSSHQWVSKYISQFISIGLSWEYGVTKAHRNQEYMKHLPRKETTENIRWKALTSTSEDNQIYPTDSERQRIDEEGILHIKLIQAFMNLKIYTISIIITI